VKGPASGCRGDVKDKRDWRYQLIHGFASFSNLSNSLGKNVKRRVGLGANRTRFGRHARYRHAPSRLSWAMALGCACSALLGQAASAQAQASGVSRLPASVAIFVSTLKDRCFDPGDVAAIKRLATAEQDRINASGGILRRQLQLQFLDDGGLPQRTIANVKKALADPQTVAMIGLSNTARAKAAFDALGSDITASGVPFLSDIAVNSIFEKHPNVFTTRASQDDERIPMLAQFIKARNVQRPAFVGLKDALFSSSLGDGLANRSNGARLVADHRLALSDDKLDPVAIAAVVADLKRKNTDLVFLAVGAARTAPLLAEFVSAGLTPPLFVTGRFETVLEAGAPEYPGDVFQLAWDNLPNTFNARLRQRIDLSGPEQWQFEGAKIVGAPGWASGECKARSGDAAPDIFDSRNMRAIGVGTQYGDMVALVAEALKTADPKSDTAGLRTHLLTQLATSYAAGRGAFRGGFENWSFRPGSRAAERTPFIVMRPKALGASQLAPAQFVRLRTGQLRRIDTLYLDIDLIRILRVDDNDKSFFAEFYLSMRGHKDASVNQIEFSNAFLDPKTIDRQISIRTLHDGGPSATFPEKTKMYLVSGKFMFDPRLANYPFDTQRFAINIRPKSADTPFIIQPPPHSLRDKGMSTEGWDPKDQYVAYEEDFVPTIDAWTLEQSIVPFYKASFVWLMQRQTTDYYLRVVVPLAFILIVAYLSVFIPQSHFEAIVTIQVTALLSAVALYLALPKLDADGSTLSDRIFVFIYMAVSFMIGISILGVNNAVAQQPWLKKAFGLLHIVLIPALVAGMAFYVYRSTLGDG
jgi:ABC-type branched-subunit amino acid transport system substrate-binding protein